VYFHFPSIFLFLLVFTLYVSISLFLYAILSSSLLLFRILSFSYFYNYIMVLSFFLCIFFTLSLSYFFNKTLIFSLSFFFNFFTTFEFTCACACSCLNDQHQLRLRRHRGVQVHVLHFASKQAVLPVPVNTDLFALLKKIHFRFSSLFELWSKILFAFALLANLFVGTVSREQRVFKTFLLCFCLHHSDGAVDKKNLVLQ